MGKIITILCCGLFALATHAESCDHDLESVTMHEQRALAVLKAADKVMSKEARMKVLESLTCLIEIQQKGEGLTKYIANSFLQTFLGAGQIKGVPLDDRYKQVSDLLVKMAEYSKDPAHMLMLEAHSKGEWGLYSLMCEKGSTEYCSDFLPEAGKISAQPPLIAASSMLLLKTAYFKLSGEQQRKVGQRIRSLYESIDKNDVLKRRVIESIYKDVFPAWQPLGLLS